VPNRYGLTGQERDRETASNADATGEMHYRARGYSPRQMRFLQNDPPPDRRAEFHYAYVQNNPVMRLDPWGMQDEGPPIKRKTKDGREYTCTCSRNLAGFLLEWAGLPPTVGRNMIIACFCAVPKEERVDVATRMSAGFGAAVAEGGMQVMRVSNPGTATAFFVAEFDTGATVEIESRSVSEGGAALRLAEDVGMYLFGRFVASKVGQLRTTALRPLAPKPSSEPVRVRVFNSSGEGGTEGKPTQGPAGADRLLEMMNRRPDVRAGWAEGDMARYLKVKRATGSTLLMEGTYDIKLLPGYAGRWTAFHEWMHRYLFKKGVPKAEHHAIIDEFLQRHKEFFRIEPDPFPTPAPRLPETQP